MKTQITTQPEEVYGYKCQIELGSRRTVWRLVRVRTLSEARTRCGLVSNAMRTLQCLPLTQEQWDAEKLKA